MTTSASLTLENLQFITGVNDTGNKCIAGVNDNGDKLMTGVKDTGDKTLDLNICGHSQKNSKQL